MTEIYYCKNENDMKRVVIHLFRKELDNTCFEDAISYSGIYCCDCKPSEIECCEECDLDECLLVNCLNNKNIHNHITLGNKEIYYPCVVCVSDTYYEDERITICSVQQAKENTKYGIE